MDALPDADQIVARWAISRLDDRPTDKKPAIHAAVGLCVAALQAGTDPGDQERLLQEASHKCQWIGNEIAQLAWALPHEGLRKSFHTVWPGINPNDPPSEPYDFFRLPFGVKEPPILMALAYGNQAAIKDTLDIWGGPTAHFATTTTQKHRHPFPALARPASWLAWSLAFRQWDLAQFLFDLPSMRDQDNLDRALLETTGALCLPSSDYADPLQHTNVERACGWINKLIEQGASLHTMHECKVSKSLAQWSIGRKEGLDLDRLASAGWEVTAKASYSTYSAYAKRVGSADEKGPSPSGVLLGEFGPITWLRRPRAKTETKPGHELLNQRIQQALEHQISGLGRLWEGASPSQWKQALSSVVQTHGQAAYRSSGWGVEPWTPDFLVSGFSNLEPQDMFNPSQDPPSPDCLWLDAIGLFMASKGAGMASMEAFYGQAVSTMARALSGDADAFVRGLQRAMVFPGASGAGRFSALANHCPLDEVLAIPGFREMLSSLPGKFQESFGEFARQDKALHEALLKVVDPDTKSIDSVQMEVLDRASQALSLHRGTLVQLPQSPVNHRPIPRM